MEEKCEEALKRANSLPTGTGAGKGSRRRKGNSERYREAWQRIFGKQKQENKGR